MEKFIRAAAEAAHEVNRVYCASIGDNTQKPWLEAEEWQRKSAIEGVSLAISGATPEQQHKAWCEAKQKDGWVFGPTKSSELKTHPCLVPYNALPANQRVKDDLYISVVRAVVSALRAGQVLST